MNIQHICGVPFSGYALHVNPFDDGVILLRVCCPAWLKPPYNNQIIPVSEDASGFVDLKSLWNSNSMIAFRKSIADGSYSFCNKEVCPRFISNAIHPLPDRAKELIKQGVFEMDYPPLTIQANIDLACNLTCPSCRRGLNSSPKAESYRRLKSILSSGIETLFLNGTGEVFRNRYLLNALNEVSKERYPNLKKISIITNGTLLNRTMWESLSKNLKDLIKDIYVSVDAASEQVYKKIRVGGNFTRLLSNLLHIGKLKKDNIIEHFTISIVLQKANQHELLDFFKLAVHVGADCVTIAKIENWGFYSHQEFSDKLALPNNWEVTNKCRIDEAKAFAANNKLYIFSNI